MQVRRILLAVAACAATSLALVTTAAQAAPSLSPAHGAQPAKALKVKGAKEYGLYFAPWNGTELEAYHQEPNLTVCPKTHTWGLELESYACALGTYETYEFKEGKVKYRYTIFSYYPSISADSWLEGTVTKTGWDDGGVYYGGVYTGAWYANKL
jgi:hypothetical protein